MQVACLVVGQSNLCLGWGPDSVQVSSSFVWGSYAWVGGRTPAVEVAAFQPNLGVCWGPDAVQVSFSVFERLYAWVGRGTAAQLSFSFWAPYLRFRYAASYENYRQLAICGRGSEGLCG